MGFQGVLVEKMGEPSRKLRQGGEVGRVGGRKGIERLRTRLLNGNVAVEVPCQTGGKSAVYNT